MEIKAENVSPEVVAAITAALQQMTNSVVAVKIKRSDNWTLSGRRSIL